MSDDDKRMTLLKIVPSDMAEDLMLKMSNFSDYTFVREHIRNRCDLATDMRHQHHGVHNVEQKPSEEQVQAVDDDVGDDVLAVMNRAGGHRPDSSGDRATVVEMTKPPP